MHTQSTYRSSWVAALLACLAFILVALPADAGTNLHRSINLAARQSLLVEQMTNGTMLAALGIDVEQNNRDVRQARDLFSRTLRGLRHGDEELGLKRAEQDEIIAEIARIETVWPRYDQMLQTVMASMQDPAGIREAQIGELSTVHDEMIDAVDRALEVVGEYAYGGNTHSILTTTLNGSVRLRSRTQQMLGELLAIAYQRDVAQSRRLLAEATREFDRTLNGLIHGDPERHLLPAANDEIRAELAKVQQIWAEVRPILTGAAAGSSVDQRAITTVSRYTGRMIGPLTMTTLLYENL